MMENIRTRLLVLLIALFLVAVAVWATTYTIQGDSSLLRNVEVADTQITPNADGSNDITTIRYEIARNATVSIYFTNESGERFTFRQARPRAEGPYAVNFSGVVDGYRLPNETIQGEILARLLQNGVYTWTIEATDEAGITETTQGQLTITEADTTLPEMRNFSLDKTTFTPNQDGIDDRVLAAFELMKEVTTLRVYLLAPDGLQYPIAEKERGVPPNMPGRHEYDYEGGVDDKATPPPDGTYPVIAYAEDAEGQKIQVEQQLTIQFGGVPRADIISPPIGRTIEFNMTAVALCDTLYFTATVRNYGTTPIRTTGPFPGTVYDSDWNYNTLGWHTESGAWRLAIGYENEIFNYPYRWAIGNPEDLTEIDGALYLMPDERAVITGGIRIVNALGVRNPQPVWAGLIHEDVEISQFNNRVDTQAILIDLPDENNFPTCPVRDMPVRIEE
jgi:hypothetical protein